MRLFIDCEWNSYKGALISMALVPIGGGDYWYERLPCPNPDPWVALHVVPVLGKAAVTVEQMCRSLALMLNQWDAVVIVADWPEDIAYFCNFIVTGPGQRIDPLPILHFEIATEAGDEARSRTPHNALADAIALREAWVGRRARGDKV